MRALATILATALLGALPAGAAAAAVHYVNPPGFSGINQYTEVVPTSSGNVPTAGSGGLGSAPGTALSSAAARAVHGTSASAKELSRFAADSAPSQSAGAGRGALPRVGGDSALGSLAQSVSDGGGMGLVLPLIMLAALILALAAILARRRARS